MAFNGSGTYTLPAGNPVVTGTTISSSTSNTTNSDIATALTNCITRDGQSTPSANLPMNAKKLTGLAAGTAAGDSVRYEQIQYINSVASAGTSGQVLTSAGAGAPTWATAPTGGFTLGTPVATTSGTAIDFTGFPANARRIDITFSGVSTSGTSPVIIQLGDAGGVETSDYIVAMATVLVPGGATAVGQSLAGFITDPDASVAAYTRHGVVSFVLLNASTNTWVSKGVLALRNNGTSSVMGGTKALSQVLTQLRITTVNGTDTFDAGEVNIAYI